MSAYSLKILNLYPREMNIYGDAGNLQVLVQRSKWRDIAVEVINFSPGDDIQRLADVDLIVGGGGQDSGQALVKTDLLRIGPSLRELVKEDVPALVVCGAFQLFGNYFKTYEGDVIEGIGIFDMHTLGSSERRIGNIVISSNDFGEIIGYENHSGKTYLSSGLEPLAKVINGSGNNGEDGKEGARYRNALGTYLHGPLLPKNPQLADFLIATALEQHYGNAVQLDALPDKWVEPAREVARSRPY